jgi:isopropylmalate/homocitrate/citramalate synthase
VKSPQKFPRKVTIFEVGPRDGLQNEPKPVSITAKLDFIRGLKQSGITQIEAGAFVRPDRVPQMAASDDLFKELSNSREYWGPNYWALVPNIEGLQRAIGSGAKSIAVFTAASESFNKKNINMTITQSLSGIREILQEAKRQKLRTRGYVSTAFGCPFEGKVLPKRAISVAERLLEFGVDQVSLGDTIGVATPADVDKVVGPFIANAGAGATAVHFHDTRGTALANSLRALEWGVSTIDASAGGLGGCPFAPGATGNLATEDLVYLLNGLKIDTGVDLETLCRTSLQLARVMDRPLSSRYLMAYAAQCK